MTKTSKRQRQKDKMSKRQRQKDKMTKRQKDETSKRQNIKTTKRQREKEIFKGMILSEVILVLYFSYENRTDIIIKHLIKETQSFRALSELEKDGIWVSWILRNISKIH